MKFHGAATGALSVDRDLVWVATKRTDVLLHPFERLDLILEASIKVAISRIRELRSGEEAERIEAVIHGDYYDVGALVDPGIERPVPWVAVDITWGQPIQSLYS